MSITKLYLKDLVYQVNGAAIEVHKALGPINAFGYKFSCFK